MTLSYCVSGYLFIQPQTISDILDHPVHVYSCTIIEFYIDDLTCMRMYY